MPFKRPLSSSDDSESNDERQDNTILVYILRAKIHPETMSELASLVENYQFERVNNRPSERNLELTADVEKADIIVTATNMRQRLERHIDWRIAKTKPIVSPSWLRDSVKSGRPLPCGSYVAVHDLDDETLRICDIAQHTPSGSSSEKETSWQTELDEPVDAAEVESLSYDAKYSCLRPSPLVCPNQNLVKELDVIRRGRNVEGEERSMLSYSRAISVIKAFPHVITEHNIQGLHELPFLGEKILSMIEEFLKAGRITEARPCIPSIYGWR